MNCEQANQLDMVDYLSSIGHAPQKIRAANYWYLSPLRQETTASFKVDRSKNAWYDHGIGKGGRLVDFICLLNQFSVAQALEQLGGRSVSKAFSFHQQKRDSALEIVSIKNNLEDKLLRNYLASRRINLSIANRFCKEIQYRCAEKLFTAIGFKNNAGGYELRSPGFKGAVSPKYVSWFDHQAKCFLDFEGFFDCLT